MHFARSRDLKFDASNRHQTTAALPSLIVQAQGVRPTDPACDGSPVFVLAQSTRLLEQAWSDRAFDDLAADRAGQSSERPGAALKDARVAPGLRGPAAPEVAGSWCFDERRDLAGQPEALLDDLQRRFRLSNSATVLILTGSGFDGPGGGGQRGHGQSGDGQSGNGLGACDEFHDLCLRFQHQLGRSGVCPAWQVWRLSTRSGVLNAMRSRNPHQLADHPMAGLRRRWGWIICRLTGVFAGRAGCR